MLGDDARTGRFSPWTPRNQGRDELECSPLGFARKGEIEVFSAPAARPRRRVAVRRGVHARRRRGFSVLLRSFPGGPTSRPKQSGWSSSARRSTPARSAPPAYCALLGAYRVLSFALSALGALVTTNWPVPPAGPGQKRRYDGRPAVHNAVLCLRATRPLIHFDQRPSVALLGVRRVVFQLSSRGAALRAARRLAARGASSTPSLLVSYRTLANSRRGAAPRERRGACQWCLAVT